jgi:hypothetical protein
MKYYRGQEGHTKYVMEEAVFLGNEAVFVRTN